MSRTTAHPRATQAPEPAPAHQRPGSRGGELISRINAAELLARNLPTLPIEVKVLELMARAKQVEEIQVVNGLVAGSITKALHGERGGTIIHTG